MCWRFESTRPRIVETDQASAFFEVNDPSPGQPTSPRSFVHITSGEEHTCGLLSDASALCWTWEHNGTLANSAPEGWWSWIDAGGYMTCAVDL